VIVSPEEGLEHCWINQNTKISLGLFDAGRKEEYVFNPINKCLFVFAINGSIEVSGNTLTERNALGIWDTGKVDFECLSDAAFLVIETPINQK
jgi:hypothetical protein